MHLQNEPIAARTYTAGSLVYTRGGLVVLFGWLLWGDFVLCLMESVVPILLPILLKTHGASNQEIAIIASSLYLVINAALNPVISYNSDRFRSRWGRRRPFIFVTTPFVVLFLAAIPFAPEILQAVSSSPWMARLLSMGPAAPLILVFGLLVAAFQVFNMFISSVYYYLIPDVVPKPLLGRFYSLFRIFGALSGMFFNYFVYGLAESHMKEIFVVIAIVYGFFILLMCWRVKEGTYPPPIREARDHWWSGIQNYAKECFGHSYYWWVFLAFASQGWANSSNVFSVFFYRDELGLTLDQIGKVGAWSGLLFMGAAYPFGILIDRWSAHKALVLSMGLLALSSVLSFFFSFDKGSGIAWMVVRNLPLGLALLALTKWTVEVYPMDRYGQFASAGAFFSCIGGIVLGPICGWWIDQMSIYRYFLVWNALFALMGMLAAMVVYQRWKLLGGPHAYQAP